jgi:UDP-3-O-acyl-N-acetylglucosamine deacetylase
VGEQEFHFKFDGPESFLKDIAPARTFGFMKDIEALQKAGLAAGGRLDNFILIGEDQVINTDLRFPDELSRHKILDIIGDLFLIGRPLRAKITARMTGHFDNIEVLKLLRNTSCS